MQRKLVDRYRDEIEELRRQKEEIQKQSQAQNPFDYLKINSDLVSFNDSVEKIRYELRKQIGQLSPLKHTQANTNSIYDPNNDLLKNEIDNLKQKLQSEMQEEENQYNKQVESLQKFKIDPEPDLTKDEILYDDFKEPEQPQIQTISHKYLQDTPDEQIPIKELNRRKKQQSKQFDEVNEQPNESNSDNAEPGTSGQKISWADIMGKKKSTKGEKPPPIEKRLDDEALTPADEYLNKPLRRPEEQASFNEVLEFNMTGKPLKRRMTSILSRRNSTKLSKTLNNEEEAIHNVIENKSTFTNKPPKYPKSISLRNKKGILKPSGQPKKKKPRVKAVIEDSNDLNTYFRPDSYLEDDNISQISSKDNRLSLREISDDEKSDVMDGKFLPDNFEPKQKKKPLNVAKMMENHIPRPKSEPEAKPLEINPKNSFRANVEPINDDDEPEDRDYSINVQDLSNMNSQLDQSINKSPQKPNKFGNYKPSLKQSILSESSVRDAYDDYVVASGEEYAGYQGTPAKKKKSVKFQKVKNLPPSTPSETELENEEREYLNNLASYKDHTNLGSFYDSKTGSIYRKQPVPFEVNNQDSMAKLNELYHKIQMEKMSPSDLILSNVYTEFLFHRNLITDREQRAKLDRMFRSAFQTIEKTPKNKIMISAQDHTGDIVPIIDPLDYLEKKKQQYKDIEIEDQTPEEGFRKGELIPMGFDREKEEDERWNAELQAKMAQFPDVNIGIPEEDRMKEEAKQAKIRELQGAGLHKTSKSPTPQEGTLEQKMSEIDNIKFFNKQVEEAMLKRDNLLKLVSKDNRPKDVSQIIGEASFDDYNADKLEEMFEAARHEQELKNLKDYEAIRILQKALPEVSNNAADLPSAVSHFLNNPFEFLVYDNPQAIPEDVREKIISENKNLLNNNEQYAREINILENQRLINRAFNKRILYDEYVNEKFDDLDPNDKNYANHLLKVIKSRKKWYPEEIQNKKRLEQLEYEYMMAEQEESEEIDYEQADVKEETKVEIDPEELKLKEEEEAKRKIRPENFKAMMLSRAGEGTDDPNYQIEKEKEKTRPGKDNKDQSINEDQAKLLGEVTVKDEIQKEDYYDYLRKAIQRNNE